MKPQDLRKLRDDDASGALKEFFGDGEDPREWNGGYAVTIADGRVTKLNLYKCTKLTVDPVDAAKTAGTTFLKNYENFAATGFVGTGLSWRR